jgi:hypothetical protein
MWLRIGRSSLVNGTRAMVETEGLGVAVDEIAQGTRDISSRSPR